METEVVRAAFHVRRGECQAQRVAQRGNVLEVDLLLKILGAGGNQRALTAQNRGDEIRQRLPGAGARLGEHHAAALEDVRDGASHLDLTGTRLELRDRAREGAVRREDIDDALGEAM